MKTLLTPFVVVVLLLISAHSALAARIAPEGPVPGEVTVEGHLLAPCCWAQTLDVHPSGLADELRHEIRARLLAGETTETIEATFVARYGERIRAVSHRNPILIVMVALLAAAFLAGVGVTRILLRWRRPAGQGSADQNPRTASPRDADDDRIDAELEALDE